MLLFVVLAVMLIGLEHVRFAGLPAIAPVLFFYGVVYGWSIIALRRRKDAGEANRFAGGDKSGFHFWTMRSLRCSCPGTCCFFWCPSSGCLRRCSCFSSCIGNSIQLS